MLRQNLRRSALFFLALITGATACGSGANVVLASAVAICTKIKPSQLVLNGRELQAAGQIAANPAPQINTEGICEAALQGSSGEVAIFQILVPATYEWAVYEAMNGRCYKRSTLLATAEGGLAGTIKLIEDGGSMPDSPGVPCP